MKKKLPGENPSQRTESMDIPVRKSNTLLYFVLRFAVMFLLFEACYFNDYLYTHVFFPVNKLFAFATAKTLTWFGIAATSTLSSVQNEIFSMEVRQGCDSIEALAIFVCGVLAFPASVKSKVSGLLIGSSVILLMNLIRLVHLFWLGVYRNDLFELFHLEIWQGFFIILSIVLWILWVLNAVKPTKPIVNA